MTEMLKHTPNVIVDLDGTLALEHHRRPLIRQSWDAYFSAIPSDIMNQSVARLMHMLEQTHNIHIITSRPEKYRKETETWLLDRYIRYHHLDMRPTESMAEGSEDWQHKLTDREFKQDIMAKHGLTPDNVMCVLEDRDEMVAMYREFGFNCWQVHENGDMFTPDVAFPEIVG